MSQDPAILNHNGLTAAVLISSLMILLTTLDILSKTVSSLPKKNSESYACHVSAHTLPLITHSTTFITRYPLIILFRPCNPPSTSAQYTLLYSGDKSLVPTLLSYTTLPLPLPVIASEIDMDDFCSYSNPGYPTLPYTTLHYTTPV